MKFLTPQAVNTETPIEMKKLLIPLSMALFLGCTSDGAEAGTLQPGLIGSWALSDAIFEEESSVDAVVAAELFDELAAQDCTLVVFTFSDDGSGQVDSKIEDLDIIADLGNFEADCPEQTIREVFTWTLDEEWLTVTDQNQESRTIAIGLSGNVLLIAGEEIDPDTFGGAAAIFTRL